MTINPLSFLLKVWTKLTSSAAQQQIEKAAQVFVKYVPLVTAFLNSGYIPARVVSLLTAYGLPVAEGLANGTITAVEEIKVLVGLAVSEVIKRDEKLGTAAANIARELALLQAKSSV